MVNKPNAILIVCDCLQTNKNNSKSFNQSIFSFNIMSESKVKRNRSKNFDSTEKDVLLESAIANKETIESKFTNQITNVKKEKYGETHKPKLTLLVLPIDLSQK